MQTMVKRPQKNPLIKKKGPDQNVQTGQVAFAINNSKTEQLPALNYQYSNMAAGFPQFSAITFREQAEQIYNLLLEKQ